MFKRNEKKTARQPAVSGLVSHGTISAMTKGTSEIQQFDGMVQKRLEAGLSAD